MVHASMDEPPACVQRLKRWVMRGQEDAVVEETALPPPPTAFGHAPQPLQSQTHQSQTPQPQAHQLQAAAQAQHVSQTLSAATGSANSHGASAPSMPPLAGQHLASSGLPGGGGGGPPASVLSLPVLNGIAGVAGEAAPAVPPSAAFMQVRLRGLACCFTTIAIESAFKFVCTLSFCT